MENIESAARPTSMNLLTRPIERNVLRELNSIEATKSPKETSLADITETHAKDDQVPVIQTNNRLSDGSDKAPLNKNLLRVSTPTETASVSDDEEFVDCNTTFNSSVINSTFEAAAILSDGNFGNPEQRVPSPNESEGPGISNKKLNLGFIETKMSGVDDLDQDKSTVDTLNSEDGECGSKDSKDSTISSSFIENSQIIDNDHRNKSIGEILSDPNANSSTEGATVPMITIEGVFASQTTIDEVAAVVPEIESASIIESAVVIESNPVMNVESKPIIETEPVVESTPVISAIESVAPMELELADRPVNESDSLTNMTVESVVETMSAVESTIESADVINSNPAINEEPKPMIETEPVIETKPVISASELEAPMETELADRPVVESDSLTNITVESVVETMSAVESTIESAAVIESNPAINEESKPIIETKPVLESTLAIESTTAVSVIESVPSMESELAHRPVNESDSLTNINVESVIETMAAVESTVESAVVTESNPVSNEEPKHLIETEPVLESTLEIESTPVISAIESVAPMESELADRSAVESGTAVNVDVEPVIETVPEIESTILHPSEPMEDVIQSAVVIASNTEINAESPIESDIAIKTELSIETKSANELEPSRESENVGALAISILQPTPIIESETTAIETESTNELDPSIESAVISQSEPTQSEVTNRSALASDPEAVTLEATIESQPLTELEPVAKCESAQVNNALNVTCNLDGTSICQPETTFVAYNDEIIQNVRIETSSSNREPEFEAIATESETIDDAKVTQANKISEFKANQSFSVDSLDQDTEPQDCSLDSLEMKVDNPSISAICSDITERFQRLNTFDLPNAVGANFDHPGADNLNASISTLSRKDTFSVSSPQNESIPSIARQDTYSLLLPQNGSITSPPSTLSGQNSQNDSCSSVDDITVLLNKVAINSPIVNAADSSNRMKRSATFEKSNSDGVNQNSPSLSADGSNASGSKFQTTPVPNLNAIDSKQDDLPEMVLSPNDFDFLQSRGGKKTDSEEDRRNSLLLRFDPLSGRTVQKQHLAPTEEVVESSVATDLEDTNQPSESSTKNISNDQSSSKADSSTANASEMSVSLVHDSKSMDNDTTNSFKNNIKADIAGGVTMTDKKIKFEYADENIRKKMEEYEATQEILVKRLAEKEKTLAKNCAIIEVYEKTLAELVADKEKLTDHHEVTNERLRQERDIHHQHLMSLEITFSDLHKKYERSKEIIMQLRERYDVLSEERAMIDHLIKQQELRYEKMKQHAIEQLEHANSTLEEQEKSNARENSRLKALLKIEEVSRNTMQEQLSQKCKENKELVKICDELIGGSGQRS